MFIYLSVDGHWGCFCLLALVMTDATNTGVPVSVCDPAFSSSGWLLRSGTAGPHGNSLFSLRHCQTDFQKCSTIVDSPSNAHRSRRLTSSPTLVIFWIFLGTHHPNACEVVSHWGLGLAKFLKNNLLCIKG